MELNKFISNSYQKVDPYEGVNAINEILVEKKFLVVTDEKEYFGILTPHDLIKRPHKIVIDCLTEKEHISADETIKSVFKKFNRNRCSVLPVFKENRFIGIIEKQHILNELELKTEELYNKSIVSQKVKSTFLHNLSHEIRTPLNGLLGFVEIVNNIQTEGFNDDLSLSSDIIRTCADRFLLIMNDLIDLSLIDSGDDIIMFKEKVRVEDVFFELKEFFDTSFSILNRKLSILYYNPNPSLNIVSDRKRIKQILYHLIDNAIKFSNDNIVKFGYKIENKDIVFFVTNNGSQIKEEMGNEIFEAFYKHHANNDEFSEGLGLGLPLVKKMSGLLGGRVDFKSNENETTFYVTFPLG